MDDDSDIYTKDGLDELMDEEGLQSFEQGFMMGFLEEERIVE